MHPQLLEKAIIAAMEAGREILSVYDEPYEIELKEDKSPLTVADRKSHNKIMEHLVHTNIPVLSEEGKTIPYNERKTWERFWMVDPLDGTKEFIKKNGEFTVNIALIENNKTIMGVIYAPVLDVLYFGATWFPGLVMQHAMISFNAAKNGEAFITHLFSSGMKMPLKTPSKKYTIIASRSHPSPETASFIEKVRAEKGDLEFISSGSSLKICLVAEGTADLYPRLAPTMEWDTAAGQAIAESTSCTFINYDTKTDVIYNKENLLNPFFIVERK